MKTKKGIPPLNVGRPKQHDFSKMKVNTCIEATLSMVVVAYDYGKKSGKKFVRRTENGKIYLCRQS